MPQVDAVHTPSSPSEVAGALVDAYRTIIGTDPPSSDSYIIPTAQAAVETAAFGQGLWNYNLGNITAANDSVDWMLLPGNSLHFRSYESLADGAADLIRWLKRHGVIQYADAGDISGYVNALQNACYVGCDPGPYPAYQKGIENYVQQYGGVVPSTNNFQKVVSMAVGGVVLGGGLYLAWEWAARRYRLA